MIRTFFVLGLSVIPAPATSESQILEAVLAHPPFNTYYTCGEHRKGELPYLGDDLGTDCVVERLVTENDRTWVRAHESDGTKNEHWFGWNTALHSPCNCEVSKVHINPVVNQPGFLGEPPASMIIFRREDGVHFVMAHVQEVSVKVGDRVEYGQAVARVGNNGYGRIPHVHIGAWKGQVALQIRWDTSIAESE